MFAPFTNSGGGANGGSSRRWRNAHTYFCRDQHRAGDQTDPHVSGDWAAYTSGISIRYYQFSTGIDSQIPADASVLDDLLSDISGSKIAFTRITAETKSAVMVFDAATGLAPIEIDPLAGSLRVGSAIGGNTVAYVDFGLQANGEIVVHDLVAGTSVRLTNDVAVDQNPSVSDDGNTVAWEHCVTPTNCDIWQAVKTGAVWTVGVVTNTASPEGNPNTNGTLVVYDSTRGSGPDIFWRPVAGGPEVQLQLTGIERNPSIAGHFVAFESQQTPANPAEIFVYDMATNRLYQITNTPFVNEQLNDIAVLPDGSLRVVWASDEGIPNGQRNIYAATFTLPGAVQVPFADFQALPIIDLPKHAFAVAGTFTLGAASNGIVPLTEPVTLQVATFSLTIPGGSFKSNAFGGFQFTGIVNDVHIVMAIQPLHGKSYAFAAVVWNEILTAAANPVTVKLAIGDDTGSRAVSAFFATVHHDN